MTCEFALHREGLIHASTDVSQRDRGVSGGFRAHASAGARTGAVPHQAEASLARRHGGDGCARQRDVQDVWNWTFARESLEALGLKVKDRRTPPRSVTAISLG